MAVVVRAVPGDAVFARDLGTEVDIAHDLAAVVVDLEADVVGRGQAERNERRGIEGIVKYCL